MIHFSERLIITQEYNEWAKKQFPYWGDKNKPFCVPVSVVDFLQINGMLNEQALHKYCTNKELETTSK